ncbi:MAG: CorA family divalent cation transporter [Acidimicrobiales bacterium]
MSDDANHATDSVDAATRQTGMVRLADGSLRVLDGDGLQEIDSLRSTRDQVVWLDIASPDDEDLALLGREFDVHELALEDMRTRKQRPKVDTYPDQHVVVTYEVLPGADGELSFELGELHAFPKTSTGSDLMMGAPTPIIRAHLGELA